MAGRGHQGQIGGGVHSIGAIRVVVITIGGTKAVDRGFAPANAKVESAGTAGRGLGRELVDRATQARNKGASPCAAGFCGAIEIPVPVTRERTAGRGAVVAKAA